MALSKSESDSGAERGGLVARAYNVELKSTTIGESI